MIIGLVMGMLFDGAMGFLGTTMVLAMAGRRPALWPGILGLVLLIVWVISGPIVGWYPLISR